MKKNMHFPKDLQAAIEKNRGKALTPRQEEFMNAVIEHDFNVREAGKAIGMSNNNTHQVARILKDEILEAMRAKMVLDAGVAMKTITDLMTADDAVVQADIKLRAAQQILDRIGLSKPEKIEIDHNVSGGLFLIPAKDGVNIKDIEGETLEQST